MKKRNLKSLKLNKKSISNFENISTIGGEDDDNSILCPPPFTKGPECNTEDVFRCGTGDACRSVVGCPSFVNC
ncbi:hypothetical protein [Kordia sp.]|uniref:hypothetical protein n=1 Tax=Kordia sp. TaxID=1965332 RepID=UPI003D6B5866